MTFTDNRSITSITYDEDGSLTGAGAVCGCEETSTGSEPSGDCCTVDQLDGSWYLQLTPRDEMSSETQQIHGVARIEAGTNGRVRISGDVYTEAITCDDGRPAKHAFRQGLRIGDNWYPQFDEDKYSCYLRSSAVDYEGGQLHVNLVAKMWDHRLNDFSGSGQDGWVRLHCPAQSVTNEWAPKSMLRLSGEGLIAGTRYEVIAWKTAQYYRGCLVEVDMMEDREWVSAATHYGETNLDFETVYRQMGIDCLVRVDDSEIPEETDLSITELHQLLVGHRDPIPDDDNRWRLWVVIGSDLGGTGTFGVMFDDIAPYREGVAVLSDPEFPSLPRIDPEARNKRLGDVPLAFLRTAVHEVGHAFNHYHPKADEHPVEVSETLMNQTGDVLGLSSEADPYPVSSIFAFNEHNLTSVVHAPDPQVKPGWTRFGYGHGGRGNPPEEPRDISFDNNVTRDDVFDLELDLPDQAVSGEFVLAELTLRNVSDDEQSVRTNLNLSEDQLSMRLTGPDGDPAALRNIVLLCTVADTTTLEPSEQVTGYVQLLYANVGPVFDRPGTYTLQADLAVDGDAVRSDPTRIRVHSPSGDELELCRFGLDKDVGRSIALGDVLLSAEDPTYDSACEQTLTHLAETHSDSDLGTAAAVVLANNASRNTRDVRNNSLIAERDRGDLNDRLDAALRSVSPMRVAKISSAVLLPEKTARPTLDALDARFEDMIDDYDDAEIAAARDIIQTSKPRFPDQ